MIQKSHNAPQLFWTYVKLLLDDSPMLCNLFGIAMVAVSTLVFPRYSMAVLSWLRVWLGYDTWNHAVHCGTLNIFLGNASHIRQFQLPSGTTRLPSRSRRYHSMTHLCVSVTHVGVSADDQGALNLALKDEIAALKWVQANIGKFGGDKKKVF